MNTTTKTDRDGYMLNVLDVCGPTAPRLVAERIAGEYADRIATYQTIDSATHYARNVVAGHVIECEREYLAACDPELWHGVTTEEAHAIRASVILDVAAELVRIASAAADDAYEARMSCRRRTDDCDCRTCG